MSVFGDSINSMVDGLISKASDMTDKFKDTSKGIIADMSEIKNSIVPTDEEMAKLKGVFDPKKVSNDVQATLKTASENTLKVVKDC